jgi:AAHS family 4-hydroxybenzoate transporter-like MFS transporter
MPAGISKAEAGPLLSASLLGVLFGAVLIGPVGDRFGRKRLITGGCSAYGILSLLAKIGRC